MLAIMLLLALAINGGLFAGAILHTATKTAEMDRLVSMAQKMWDLPFSF
ncbi:MAG: hypothetical protein HY370_08735 [Proteobacteria bacterium]|nr:hypothetical protein [Pseudomonadota bacterium]